MAHSIRLSLAVLLAAALATQAIPAPPHASSIVRRQDASQITPIPLAQIESFKPYTHYASTAYCQPSSTLNWTCGPNCDANPSFMPVNSGGDGAITQFWFVGYDPVLNEVIVSHQGTDTSKIFADLTDADIPLVPLDHKLFPDVNLPVLVHMGFAATHSRSAPGVLAAVQTALSNNQAEKVTVVGHSLGAAIALLDTVFLQLQLPNTTSVRAVVYGMPRVGNQAFADYVDDALPTSVTHVNNKKDPVPILPPILLGFRHPSGEIHIDESENWLACPGQDNPSTQCIVGSANLLVNNETNHDGPYDGVEMGC